jgi:hypothetical protein
MRKMRCLFSAALLAVAATVAVPAMAADAPAGPVTWTAWWQDLSVWMERLSPFGGKAVAASSDSATPTADGNEKLPPPPAGDDDGGVLSVTTDGEPQGDTGPYVDPDG